MTRLAQAVRLRVEFGVALLADLVGAAGALLVAGRSWQVIRTPRPQPLAEDLLHVHGRSLDAAPTALALVALAGVVAVLATRGWARRIIGMLLALTGAGVIWRSLADLGAVDVARARSLVVSKHPQVGMSDDLVPHIATRPVWAVLSALCGLLVLLAGAVIAWRGGHWGSMSAKYDAPAGDLADAPVDEQESERRRAKADAELWRALDRGEDPTQRE